MLWLAQPYQRQQSACRKSRQIQWTTERQVGPSPSHHYKAHHCWLRCRRNWSPTSPCPCRSNLHKINRCWVKEEDGPSTCIACRHEYTSNALSSLKLSREAIQVTVHSLHTQAPCSDPTTGHRQHQTAVIHHYWITTHLTNPVGMAGWVGHVGWLIAYTLRTKWSHGRPSV